MVELLIPGQNINEGAGVAPSRNVEEIRSLPASERALHAVRHVPDDVAEFFSNAVRVLEAGVADASAVQLRKTLEAAAAHKGVQEKTLYASVEKLIADGLITKDFSKLLDHVRRIGNMGAHYTDERLSVEEVERSIRFTTQVLRNLFEVPGELAELDVEASEE